jgi:hypothetical protein
MKGDAFQTEAELFSAVEATNLLQQLHCRTGWQIWTDTEVKGLFGQPDYIVGYYRIDCRGRWQVRTVAFEMKLANWKRALIQAFRYAAFAHYAYVLLDASHVTAALISMDRFLRANIGLLSFSQSGGLKLHHRPVCRTPYSAPLQAELRRRIYEQI